MTNNKNYNIDFSVTFVEAPNGRIRPVVKTAHYEASLVSYYNQEDAMKAALEHITQEFKRRDYGKLFPTLPDDENLWNGDNMNQFKLEGGHACTTLGNRVIRDDGKVAVLISKSGLGWFTANLQDPECLFDPVVVEAVLIKSMLLPSYFSEENDYSKNFNSISHRIDQLKIEWLPIGTTFQVVDGGDNGEWIQKFKDIKLFTA